MLKHVAIPFFVLSLFCPMIEAQDYLNAAEVAAISAASVAIGLSGERVNGIAERKTPVISGHLPLETGIQRWLGGNCQIGKSNFLDNQFGATITPLVSALALAGVNLGYPRHENYKDAAQDLFLFSTGAIATKGITDFAKGIFARERPFIQILGQGADSLGLYSDSYNLDSFFSGHTSGAFFATGFLNLRIRNTMRREMTPADYKSWRWVSSGVLYGWASFVGLSRVHAYKHYLSDVVAGAVVGSLVAELIYNLAPSNESTSADGAVSQFQVVFRF